MSRAEVYRLISLGQLTCVRFGEQMVRVRMEDLVKFIDDHIQYGKGGERKATEELKIKA